MAWQRYRAHLMRWGWLLLLGAVLAGGTSYLLSQSMPRVYQATNKLLVTPANSALLVDFPTLTTAERLARTYVDLIKTHAVLDAATAMLDADLQPASAAATVDAQPVPNTGFIQVSVEAADPRLARDMANAVGQAFIAQNDAAQQARFRGPRDNLAQRMEQLASQIDQRAQRLDALKAQQGASDPPGAAAQVEIERLTREIADLQQTYGLIIRSYEDVRLAEVKDVDTVAMVEPAALPATPVRPNIALNILVAAALGLLVSLLIILLTEYSDGSASTPERLGQAVGLATLAVVGELTAAAKARLLANTRRPLEESAEELAAPGRAGRDPSETEAYQVLGTNLRFIGSDQPMRMVLVTSAATGEGKTTTATNLALVLALAGFDTLLVDADLRRPSLHSVFETHNRSGLTTLLREGGEVCTYRQATGLPTLALLTAGPPPSSASALLGSRRLSACLTQLSQSAEYVIIDSPPVLAAPDALALAPQVDGVVLVVNARGTRSSAVLRAWEALERLGVRRGGLVLNRFQGRLGEYYAGYAPQPLHTNGVRASGELSETNGG